MRNWTPLCSTGLFTYTDPTAYLFSCLPNDKTDLWALSVAIISVPVTRTFPFQRFRRTIQDSHPPLAGEGMQRSLGRDRIAVLCPPLCWPYVPRADPKAMTNDRAACHKALSPTLIFFIIIIIMMKSSDTEARVGLIFCKPLMSLNSLSNITQRDCLITVIRECGRNLCSVKEALHPGNGCSSSRVHQEVSLPVTSISSGSLCSSLGAWEVCWKPCGLDPVSRQGMCSSSFSGDCF